MQPKKLRQGKIPLDNIEDSASALNMGKGQGESSRRHLESYNFQNFEALFRNIAVDTEEPQQLEENFDDIYLDREGKMLKQSKCLIRGHSTFKLRWDVLIMILAIFNCFAIPFEVAFNPGIMNTVWFLIINLSIDV